MDYTNIPSFLSFAAFFGIGAYIFLQNRRERVNILFALGMGSLALMEFGNFISLVFLDSGNVLFWKRISFVGECFVPLFWLAFSMSFARREPWYSGRKWRIAFIAFGITSTFFAASVLSNRLVVVGDTSGVLPLGRIGRVFYVLFLLSSVLIVANLEHTVRQARGEHRVGIRYFTLGLGGVFAFLILLIGQNLLFSQISLNMVPIASSVFFICSILIAFSLVRYRLMDVKLYMSRFVIYNSLTLFVVGVYLILVGLMTQVFKSFDLLPGYPLEILFVFVAVLLLFGLFLSDRIRWRARMFINRHFYRSRYDYRGEWRRFSDSLSLKLDMRDLISTVVHALRNSLGVNDVTLWLNDANSGRLRLWNTESPGKQAELNLDRGFLEGLLEKKEPFQVDASWARTFVKENGEVIQGLRASIVVPLVSSKGLVGVILLGKKTSGEDFLGDDMDLLESVGAQIAGAIVNAKLSQELIQAKEMEVFHRFSSFVLHDLKNLVSNLSLIVQNSGEHMSNPEFQHDALKTVQTSVEKMEATIARLSSKTAPEVPRLEEADLNKLVQEVVEELAENRGNRGTVKLELGEIQRAMVDREQIERVVTNLVLNAFEALENGGVVTIRTGANDDRVIVSVSDNGRGMSRDFMGRELFKPFKSTKKKGLGIGLYQCKTIVEHHGGRIEVESEEGVGSSFRVVLPARQKTADDGPMTLE